METLPLEHVIGLSAILFAIGLAGAITRRNIIVLMVIVVAAAEVAVGLGILIALFRNRESVDVEEASLLRW